MAILSGFEKAERYEKQENGYKKISQWTSSQSVEMDNGNTLETDLEIVEDTLGYKKINLLDVYTLSSDSVGTLTPINKGEIQCANKTGAWYQGITNTLKLEPNKTYTLSCKGTINGAIYLGTGSASGNETYISAENTTVSKTGITDSDGNINVWFLCNHEGESISFSYYDIQLERGSEVTPYQEYIGSVDERLTANETALLTTKTATGNPISISDSAHVNAKELTVELEPVQDLHGYDKPWVGGAGKNKWDEETLYGYYLVDDGKFFNDTSQLCSKNLIPVSPSTSYRLVGGGNSVIYYNSNQEFMSGIHISPNNIFTTPSGCYYIRFNLGDSYGSVYNHDVGIIYPSSETAYEPYSNISPITGYGSTSLVRSGKNLYAGSPSFAGYERADAWSIASETYNGHEVREWQGSWNGLYKEIPVKSGVTYTFSAMVKASENVMCIIYNATNSGLSSMTVGTEWVKMIATFTASSDYNERLRVESASSNATLYVSEYQLEINSQATSYEPYTADTYTLQFGDTVYGAEVDFVSGVAKVKMIQSVITGGVEGGNVGANGLYIGIVARNAKPSANNSAGNIISDKLQTVTADYQWVDTNNSVSINNIGYVQVCIENITSNSDLNTYLASNPVQICYELAEPYEIQLTPQQIKMLKGNNVLTADGDMDLTYQTDSVVGDVKEWAEEKMDELNGNISSEIASNIPLVINFSKSGNTYSCDTPFTEVYQVIKNGGSVFAKYDFNDRGAETQLMIGQSYWNEEDEFPFWISFYGILNVMDIGASSKLIVLTLNQDESVAYSSWDFMMG